MKVLKLLDAKLEEVFLVVLMSVATLLVFAQVITRWLGIPLPWSEEIARYMFLWLVWVGAAFATKERKHISITVMTERLPKLGKKICAILVNILWVGFVIFMMYVSFTLTNSIMQGGATATGSGMPMWIAYASIPVGMTLMLYRMIQNFIVDFRSVKEGGGA